MAESGCGLDHGHQLELQLVKGRETEYDSNERRLCQTSGRALDARPALMRQVKAFQHVRETGEVTPSGWQPGDPTLTPGPELAGKVWQEWKP